MGELMFTLKVLNITKDKVAKYDQMCDRIEEIERRIKKQENINNVNVVHCNDVISCEIGHTSGPVTLPSVISVPENNRGLDRCERINK